MVLLEMALIQNADQSCIGDFDYENQRQNITPAMIYSEKRTSK